VKTQPTPTISSADIERIVARDFAAEFANEVLSILGEFGTEEWQKETNRVRIAALKLAAGSIERLRAAIETGKRDYRDLLALAEYPLYMRSVGPSEQLSPEERQRIIEADWQQYCDWLERES
jgi:hypothetical protein